MPIPSMAVTVLLTVSTSLLSSFTHWLLSQQYNTRFLDGRPLLGLSVLHSDRVRLTSSPNQDSERALPSKL